VLDLYLYLYFTLIVSLSHSFSTDKIKNAPVEFHISVFSYIYLRQYEVNPLNLLSRYPKAILVSKQRYDSTLAQYTGATFPSTLVHKR